MKMTLTIEISTNDEECDERVEFVYDELCDRIQELNEQLEHVSISISSIES